MKNNSLKFKFIRFLITAMGLRTALFGTKPPELTVCPYHKAMQRAARFLGVRIAVEGPRSEIRRNNGTQARLDGIKTLLAETCASYKSGQIEDAKSKARRAKELVRELASYGDFKRALDGMFRTEVPEQEIQQFIARA